MLQRIAATQHTHGNLRIAKQFADQGFAFVVSGQCRNRITTDNCIEPQHGLLYLAHGREPLVFASCSLTETARGTFPTWQEEGHEAVCKIPHSRKTDRALDVIILSLLAVICRSDSNGKSYVNIRTQELPRQGHGAEHVAATRCFSI